MTRKTRPAAAAARRRLGTVGPGRSQWPRPAARVLIKFQEADRRRDMTASDSVGLGASTFKLLTESLRRSGRQQTACRTGGTRSSWIHPGRDSWIHRDQRAEPAATPMDSDPGHLAFLDPGKYIRPCI